ncbi:hypothetical protein AAG570_003572 [Ranatra chinensis]|uniref:Transposase n=1 Tax=Ranatra chinensis TaxID=642074 RepID=A0ABD0YIH3_9HEMI
MAPVGHDLRNLEEDYNGIVGRNFSRGRKACTDFLRALSADGDLMIRFLMESGLLKDRAVCRSCGRDMTLSKKAASTDGFIWYCGKRNQGRKCHKSVSVRDDTWFSNSRLSLAQILLLTCELLYEVPAGVVAERCATNKNTVTNWYAYIEQTLQEYLKKIKQSPSVRTDTFQQFIYAVKMTGVNPFFKFFDIVRRVGRPSSKHNLHNKQMARERSKREKTN